MSSWSRKESKWKDEFRAALVSAGQFEKFFAVKETIRKELHTEGLDPNSIVADKRAWREAAKSFPGVFDHDAFESKMQHMKEEKAERFKKNVNRTLTTKNPDGTICLPQDIGVEDKGDTDILRDTKWVYVNMARLMKKDRKTGLTSLDPKVLKEAPSNGAIGLASYALEDRKAFYEKYVTKILPKDEVSTAGKSEEELKAELDPTYDDIEKYMQKLSG